MPVPVGTDLWFKTTNFCTKCNHSKLLLKASILSQLFFFADRGVQIQAEKRERLTILPRHLHESPTNLYAAQIKHSKHVHIKLLLFFTRGDDSPSTTLLHPMLLGRTCWITDAVPPQLSYKCIFFFNDSF